MVRLSRTWHGLLGLAVFIAATVGSLLDVAGVRLFYYQLAWWSYILMVDAAIKLRAGNSLIIDRQRSFWLMAAVSAVFWFGWELVNLRLHNWAYTGVPREVWLRWPGAVLAYATVLPGVLETYELLAVLGIRWGKGVRPLPRSVRWKPYFFVVGAIMFALPLIWPRLFFPLVWGALVFLLEPINHRWGSRSLMRAWQRGDLSPFARLLLAGLITGVLWESWNFLAGARWQYTLPYLASPKVFAMPLAGYGGFPPFAVECYVFFAAFSLLRGGRGWEADDHDRALRPGLPGWAWWLLALGGAAFSWWMLGQIDRHLVAGWL